MTTKLPLERGLRRRSIFYIKPGQENFASALVSGIQTKLANFNLARITILLPSKRSCEALKATLISLHHQQLPKIIPIGELGEELFTEPSFSLLELKLLIAKELKKEKKINYSKAIILASELIEIISHFERDDIDLSKIDYLNLQDLPAHAQELIGYLKFINDRVLKSLKSTNRISRRNKAVASLIEKWQNSPPKFPIIAAGSTGSIKSTATLLKAISELPYGYVVLHGVDMDIDEHSWNDINELHPSFQIKSLLDSLKINRGDIQDWSTASTCQKSIAINGARAKFLSEAMCPPSHSMNWHKLKHTDFKDLSGFQYVECRSSQEEALVIMLKLRELVNKNYNNIAIVTCDLELIKRIKSLNQLWNRLPTKISSGGIVHIEMQSSYGISLFSTPQIGFLYATLEAIDKNFSPLSLAAVLTSNFFQLQYNQIKIKELTSKLNILYLRGICKYKNLETLIQLALKNEDAEVAELLQKILLICDSLVSLFRKKRFGFNEALQILLEVIVRFSENEDKQILFWQGTLGDEFKSFFEELSKLNIDEVTFDEFKFILYQCFTNKIFAPPTTPEPEFKSKVQILSPIESRLLEFDYVILAGLNEGIWPQSSFVNSWFSQATKTIGLTGPSAQIGKAAHDFYCLMLSKELLITRACNVGGSVQTASRWIVRIEALAKKIGKLEEIKPLNSSLIKQAREFFLPDEFVKYAPPSPKPALALRPKTLSVTQIEKLIRDPYSIYAAKILNLKKLEPLEKLPDQLEFGNFVHKVIDEFNKQYHHIKDGTHLEMLRECGLKKLEQISDNPIIKKMWLPRFQKIAEWLVSFERLRRANENLKVYSEIKGCLSIMTKAGAVTITTKADRIEVVNNGVACIIDFKTGSIPTKQDMLAGFSPQLPLEALIASQNGFNFAVSNRLPDIGELIYIQLGIGSKLGTLSNMKADMDELVSNLHSNLTKLVNLYMDEGTPYLICPHHGKAPAHNEFEHLERIMEWFGGR